MTLRLFVAFCILFPAALLRAQTAAVSELIERILPDRSVEFICESIPAENGHEVYEYEAGSDGTIVLRGSSGLALSVAFNQYLRQEAKMDYSWLASGPLSYPGPLPKPAALVHHECLASERFILNYCTFGYTMPWWGWDQWQRFVDWMAMNGINRPLLQSGQEAVWLRVWESYGISESEVCAYFTGPAQLPWHRMANLDHWGSPLGMSYIEGQRHLQEQILRRARELGMKPILSGFAGHVPQELARIRPTAKITQIKPGWGHLPADYATWFLAPEDPLFQEVQRRFLDEQTALYGTDHLYAADPFNEMTPPSWEPAYMAKVGAAIYGGMAAADPKAKWYQMTWTFTYDKHWTGEVLAAMLHAVPLGRMVLLDYVGETHELYPQSNNCDGLPFIWNYLGDFGGNTHLIAPLHKVASRIPLALDVPNCIGVGSTLEGLGATPVIYDLVFEQPWLDDAKLDVNAWIRTYAIQRAGRVDPAVQDAWSLLAEKVFVDGSAPTGNHGVVFQDVPDFGIRRGRTPETAISYHPSDLVLALGKLWEAQPESKKADGYRYDMVNFTRQALGDLGLDIYRRMKDALVSGNLSEFKRQSAAFLELGRDMDELLGTRREFLLGVWIADARRWGATGSESDSYEENAREIITSWHKPGGFLTDYASRQWNGLMRDYYLPRWQKWIELTSESMSKGTPFPKEEYAAWLDGACATWIHSRKETYLTEPEGDPVEVSRKLWNKYGTQLSAPSRR